ncbi:hypothetical protein N7510_008251 [Penicillium lagena]|uniref:uncharacterized protein n=1 Tax=Penicillium lagena TaxID=94218 RepID=UPI0025420241|nr:uncharacterized protein N7510_008251 [Penicillium lagena]KAJ5605470.1 hypothetical protein N7510_008251 [Penicillium lagena]
MADETPCSACTWSPDRQSYCSYKSHVHIFYEAGDRGVWSIGSKYILKERSCKSPSYESVNTRFVKENTTIPIPSVLKGWNDEDERYFLIAERVPGEILEKIWPKMSTPAKERLAQQTTGYLKQLRQLHSPKIQSVHGQPVYDNFLFPGYGPKGYEVPHGPLSSDEQLWNEMTPALKNLPDVARANLREKMPSAQPYTFTHGDLTTCNIMVDPDTHSLTAIIDWENAGYFPVWWEFARASISYSDDDKEWKDFLRSYMPDHSAGREFWRDIQALAGAFPSLVDRGRELIRKCGIKDDDSSQE